MSQNKNKMLLAFWISLSTTVTLYYNNCSEVSFDKMATFSSQSFEVKASNKVDILVVMDNSGSMKTEMASMANRFSSFTSKLKSLDWQLGIITTDNRTSVAYGTGKLIPLVGLTNQFILTPAMGLTQAQQVFANTIQMPTNGAGAELGLATTIGAIMRSPSSLPENAPNKQLFRPDAALAVLIVSDAADTGSTTPNDVINMVKTTFGNKTFTFNSIVIPENSYTNASATTVNPADPCKDYRESVKYDGRKYHQLSELTGGIKGTACTNDYSAQLENIGALTASLVNSVTLDCQPTDSNHDGVVDAKDVEIRTSNGIPIKNYEVSGRRVTFTEALPVGKNEFLYFCLI